jgi:hypothetical protein
MRLFHTLTSNQKAAAIKHCIDTIIRDLIHGSIFIDPVDEASMALAEMINDAVFHISGIPSIEDKVAYIMGQDLIREAIHELGSDLAYNTIYLDDDEAVIYVNSLEEPEKLLSSPAVIKQDDVIDEEDLDDEFLDIANNVVKKNPYNLN